MPSTKIVHKTDLMGKMAARAEIDFYIKTNISTWNWPRGYKKKSFSTQLITKFILPINVKMPTIVGILTFISMINTTSEGLKARNFFICGYFSVYEQLTVHAQLSFKTSRPELRRVIKSLKAMLFCKISYTD